MRFKVVMAGLMAMGLSIWTADPGAAPAQTAPVAQPLAPAIGPMNSTMPRANDARMDQIIRSISPDRIKAMDEKLVSFGSRVGTSESKSTETRGAVPARKWIAAQFQEISDANGGRLKVSIDTFPVPKGSRVPEDQTMSNVVAILPGTDPNDKRVFVVSGHYDSIPADFTQDAPGANDDASGTIVSMECARALAGFKFPATIMFLTVEGEEQGLIGSTHAAEDGEGGRTGHRRDAEQRHRRRRPDARPREQESAARVQPGRSGESDARGDRAHRRRLARERLAVARARALRVVAGGDVSVAVPGRARVPARIASSAVATMRRLSKRATRRCASRSSTRTRIISISRCASRTASNTATCRSGSARRTSRTSRA